jgi:hypothetical protein
LAEAGGEPGDERALEVVELVVNVFGTEEMR